jgi:hypothetical protein
MTTSSLTSVDKILAFFPEQTIPTIVGEPTYDSVSDLAAAIKSNAAAVLSAQGGGQLGHLILTVTPQAYLALSGNVPYQVPVNPGPFYVPGPNLTGPQMLAEERVFNAALAEYNLYQNTDRALKQQIISAIDPIYIRELKHRITGFANITTATILAHLYRTYGNITAHDLDENDKRFKQPFNVNQPFQSIIQQIDEAVDYAIAGETPYTSEQIVTNAYNLVYNTGMFPESCREWRRRTAAAKTYDNFKAEFSLAHQDLRNLKTTSQGAGYQANSVTESFCADTQESISHLASAASSDRSTIQAILDANKVLMEQLSTLTKELSNLRDTVHKNGSPTNNNNNKDGTGKKRYKNTNYCWTHGFDCHDSHNSATCKNPKEGHQKDATKNNTMNGSTINKNKK